MDSVSAISGDSYKSRTQSTPRPRSAKEPEAKPRKTKEYYPFLSLEIGADFSSPAVTGPIHVRVPEQYAHTELMDEEEAETYKPGDQKIKAKPWSWNFFAARAMFFSVLGFGFRAMNMSGISGESVYWGRDRAGSSEFIGNAYVEGYKYPLLEIVMRSPVMPLRKDLVFQLEYSFIEGRDLDLYYRGERHAHYWGTGRYGVGVEEYTNIHLEDEFKLGSFKNAGSHRTGALLKWDMFEPREHTPVLEFLAERTYMLASLYMQMTQMRFEHAADRQDFVVKYTNPTVQFGLYLGWGLAIF